MHKSKAGKLQSGSTFPKQYWLAVNGKPKRINIGNIIRKQTLFADDACCITDGEKKSFQSLVTCDNN